MICVCSYNDGVEIQDALDKRGYPKESKDIVLVQKKLHEKSHFRSISRIFLYVFFLL